VVVGVVGDLEIRLVGIFVLLSTLKDTRTIRVDNKTNMLHKSNFEGL